MIGVYQCDHRHRAYAAYVQAFLDGLGETGHVDGRNVAIEYRWAEGHYERIPQMVDELVRRRVAVLAPNTPAAQATKRAAGNIPVVFFTGEGTRSRAASSKA